MKKHLALPSILKRAAAARLRAGRRRAVVPAVVVLVVLALSSASFAGAARNLLRRSSSFVGAPSALRPLLAGAGLLAQPSQSNSLNVARKGHTATRLPDGGVLVVGGENAGGPVNSSEIFDPATRTFTLGASAGAARTEHAALRLNDGRILVTGGRDQSGVLDSTEIYDPASGTFAAGPSMIRARAGHSATLLADNRVLVAGGDEEGTAEVIDAQATATTLLDEPLYTARMNHSALRLQDGKILVVGGNGPFGNKVQGAEIFDPAEESFSAIPGAMKVPRSRPTLREMPNGFVQVVGGDDEGTIEVYVPATDDFQAYAHLPGSTPLADALSARTRSALFRAGQTDALLNRAAHTLTEIPQPNLALVAGGASGGGQILNTVAVVNSSSAAITTDKIDYAPGQLVTITGSGFQPNETVALVLHEEQAAHADRTFTAVADAAGNFTNTDFTPEAHHFGIHFVLTAKGQSSAFVAQTAFTDAGSIDVRVTIGNTFRFYGQTAPPLRVNLCTPLTDGSGDCTPINGKTVEFAVNGEVVGSDVTGLKDVGGGVMADGMAVVPYAVLKNAGAYTVVASFAGDDDYQADQGTSTLTVGKALTTITWATPAAVTYGTALGTTQLNATIKDTTSSSQFTNQPVAGSFDYVLTTGVIPAMGYVPNAGANALKATFTPTDSVNYAPNSRNNSISVSKVLLTVTPNSHIRLYGQPNPELTGTVVGLVNNDQLTPFFATTATQSTGVGNYDITFAFTDPANKLKNYTQPAPPKKGTLAINKAPLNVKADDRSRPFGVDNPPLTFAYSGFVLGESASVLGGTPTLSTTANASSAAGTYPITLSVAGMTAANYDLLPAGATLTVTQAQSVLNLSGLSQTYDGTPKPITVTTNPPGLSGVSVSYSTNIGDRSFVPVNAGSYNVTATLRNPDYKAEPVTGTLVINKAEQIINFTAIPDKKFGGAPLALAATSSANLPVVFEVVSGNATLSGNTLTLTGAGSVTVRATQAGDANRNPAAPVTRTFNVAKADATINILPASLSQTYNGTPRTATVTTTPAGLSGLVVSYSEQDGTPISAPTNAGTYKVTAALDNPKYTTAPVSATLVIAQATVQVSLANATHVFDGKTHPINATVTGGGQNIGTLTYSYTPQGNVGPDGVEPAIPNPPPGPAAPVPPAPAYTVLHDPPVTPHNITVFPERDFISAENYSASDGQVTINVLRRDATGALVTVGSATATPEDDPTTPQFDGIFEVNHPGGSCWVGQTPNIRPGDIVRVTNAAGVADQTTVAHVSAGRPVQVNANTVRISGRAMDDEGEPLPIADIEQRLISSSADPFVLSGRRDLRAPGNGILVYDDEEDPTHWTATYTNLTPADVARALRVETRILWLGRDQADENELTIFEIGDDVFAGPQAPCSAPLEGTSPVMPFPVPPAPAYTTLNDPPTTPRNITVFPERDFVSIENFAAADGPVTINVLRRVTVNGATTLRTVGSSTVELEDDPTTPQFDGLAEVNHPGGGCWVGSTPDIQPGDIVRVTTHNGVAHQTTVANVIAQRVQQLNANTVVVHGTARDAAGNPLPIADIEQRMISSSADRFNVNGRRDIRAVSGGGEIGTLAYDAPGSFHWTATYTNLGSQDVARALRSETRILWLGRDQAAENELTIFEIGDDVFAGPQAPCNAPREGSDLPVWVGVYDVSVSLTGNPNFRVEANTAQINITKATPAVNVEGGPFNYDGQPHPAEVKVVGIGGAEFVPPTANTIIKYYFAASGPGTTDPPVRAGLHEVIAAFGGSKNYNAAQGGHKLYIENNAPVATGDTFTTDEGRSVEVTLSASDADGNTPVFSIVGNPANGQLSALTGDTRCALSQNGPISCNTSVTYTPNANFSGTDTFTFKANDGTADSNVATVTITVKPVTVQPTVLTFNAVNDFSPTQNQGAAWSYGSRAAGGGAFAPLPNNDNLYGLAAGMHTWYLPSALNLPVVIHNGTGSTQSYYGATHPTDLLNLFPGGAGELSVVRWTAPRAGMAQVAGRFQGLDATTTAVSVVKNGSITLFSGNVNGLGNRATFSLSVAVAAGDTVEFRVHHNGDVQHDSTGLAATITVYPVYDAVANFSAGQNPSGAWSYGSRAAGGGAFALLPNNNNLFGLPAGMSTWYVPNAFNLPAVIHNGTGSTQSYYGATHPPGLLNLFPGATGEKSVVRWTARAAGTAQVAGRFQGLDATTTAVSVVKNGSTTLFSGNVNGLGNQVPFSLSVAVAVGDTIEFQVAYNGDVQHDSTGLAATVTMQPPVVLADDFNDNSMDTAKWTATVPQGMTIVEQNQRLEMTPSATSNGYGGFSTISTYDLTDTRTTVEVVQGTNVGGLETIIQFATANADLIFYTSGTNLLMQERAGGVVKSQTIIPYDPAQHHFWRFRHDSVSGLMHWETSPDNVTWAARHSAALTISIAQMRLNLAVGRYAATSASATAIFDNLVMERRLPLAPSDGFNDNLLDTVRWTPFGPPTSVLEQNQRLEVALTPNVAGYYGVFSASAFSFLNKTLQVEVPQVASTAGWVETGFQLRLDDNNMYSFAVGAQGGLVFDALVNGVRDRTPSSYNAAQHRFWRFRHNAAAHTMNFEVSGDGKTWTTTKTANVNISLEAVRAWAYAGAWGTGNASPGAAYFDNLKLEANE